MRRQLMLLQKLEDNHRHTPSTPGCSPWLRGQLIMELQGLSVNMLDGTVLVMLAVVDVARRTTCGVLEECTKALRAEQKLRWQEVIPELWRPRSAVVHG